MSKAALFALVIAFAACGGGKKKTETPVETGTSEKGAPEGGGGGGTAEKPAEKPAEPAKPAGPSPEELAKQALADQLEAGKKVYTEKKCDTCHGADGAGKGKTPAIIGAKALPEKASKTAKLRKGVTFKTAKDVMEFVKAKMPLKGPGTLSDEEAAAVTAWMLTEGKVTVDKKLDAESAAAINLR